MSFPNTPAVEKSLKIVRDNPGIRPREFAVAYHGKDHPGFKRHSKAGPNGSTRGGGMNLWGGSWLGKLRREGLVDGGFWPDGYRISTKGKGLLSDFEAERRNAG